MFNSQDTKPFSNSKENRKSNDGATAPREIYLFPQSCRRVQFSRYKSLERFDAKASKSFTLIAIRQLAKCFTNVSH